MVFAPSDTLVEPPTRSRDRGGSVDRRRRRCPGSTSKGYRSSSKCRYQGWHHRSRMCQSRRYLRCGAQGDFYSSLSRVRDSDTRRCITCTGYSRTSVLNFHQVDRVRHGELRRPQRGAAVRGGAVCEPAPLTTESHGCQRVQSSSFLQSGGDLDQDELLPEST